MTEKNETQQTRRRWSFVEMALLLVMFLAVCAMVYSVVSLPGTLKQNYEKQHMTCLSLLPRMLVSVEDRAKPFLLQADSDKLSDPALKGPKRFYFIRDSVARWIEAQGGDTDALHKEHEDLGVVLDAFAYEKRFGEFSEKLEKDESWTIWSVRDSYTEWDLFRKEWIGFMVVHKLIE